MQWQAYLTISATIFGVVQSADLNSSIKALSIPPSEFWLGNDGQWSTFFIQAGTPGQLLHVLPGTSATASNTIWAVLPEGCSMANPQLTSDSCARSRGGTFVTNSSTTWSTSRLANNGLYALPTLEESMLGLGTDGNAYYGFDTVMLGQTGSGLPVLSDQLVLGYATNGFWLGTLGLSPLGFNFTSNNNPIPSVLGRLRDMNVIPSTSWAYTAGAIYKEPPVFGSLTLGGYDQVRMQDDGISLPFWTDQSRDLLIGLQSITYDTLGSSPLLADGIYIFIDSMVTHLWLPLPACQTFEQAFGLSWNSTAELYLLNSTTHANLVAQNPTFTFTIGSSDSGGDNTTTITLPYAAFDLNMTLPDGSSSWYFPLKRAQNSSQYTLGRVFLQEAYVIADYERKNFTMAQAAFPAGSDQDLRTILPPGVISSTPSSQHLGVGSIAGIVVGAVVLLIFLVAMAVYLLRRRRRRRVSVLEKDSSAIYEKHGDSNEVFETEDSSPRYLPELSGPDRAELVVVETYRRAELHAENMPADNAQRHELAGSEAAVAELGMMRR